MQLSLPTETKNKEQLVLRRLKATKSLLILNNFEDVGNDQEIISFLNKVSSPSKVLITSRYEPPQKSWRLYELKELHPNDALQLFINFAEKAGISLKDSNFDASCRSPLRHSELP